MSHFKEIHYISIRAPAKGATLSVPILTFAFLFQSALPRRERHFFLARENSRLYFNPRSREGSDLLPPILMALSIQFQSALPRRERRFFSRFVYTIINFNPRSREGSDRMIKSQKLVAIRFQSALPRRERQCPICGKSLSHKISIRAPAKGATFNPDYNPDNYKFQSALPRRERQFLRV